MTYPDLVQLRVSAAETFQGLHDIVTGAGAWYDYDEGGIPHPVWNTIEDANDALRLIEVLHAKGYSCETTRSPNYEGWHCSVYIWDTEVHFSVNASTAPLAITLAALRAMGKGEEK